MADKRVGKLPLTPSNPPSSGSKQTKALPPKPELRLVLRYASRLHTWHKMAVTCKQWQEETQESLKVLRDWALDPDNTQASEAIQAEGERTYLAIDYCESRLVNHVWDETWENKCHLSKAFTYFLGRVPKSDAMIPYACSIAPSLRGLSGFEWIQMQSALPQGGHARMLLDFAVKGCDDANQIFSEPVDSMEFDLSMECLATTGTCPDYPAILDSVAESKWDLAVGRPLFANLQKLAPGAGKTAAFKLMLDRKPSLVFMLEMLKLTLSPSDYRSAKVKCDYSPQLQILQALLPKDLLANEKDYSRPLMLTVAYCVENLKREDKKALLICLTQNVKNLVPLAKKELFLLSDLYRELLKIKSKATSRSKTEAGQLINQLKLHGITWDSKGKKVVFED